MASGRSGGKSHRRRHGHGRGRSRKRRPAPETEAVEAAKVDPSADRKKGERERAPARTRTRSSQAGFRDPLSVGERPPAPWHPWPLSELLILVGAVGTVVGLTRLSHGGIANGGPVLFVGLGAVAFGTIEVTWREHNAGYRSHTLILALLPVVVFHSALALSLAAFTTVSRLANVGLLAVDAGLFAVLFKLLSARFKDARARVVSRR